MGFKYKKNVLQSISGFLKIKQKTKNVVGKTY